MSDKNKKIKPKPHINIISILIFIGILFVISFIIAAEGEYIANTLFNGYLFNTDYSNLPSLLGVQATVSVLGITMFSLLLSRLDKTYYGLSILDIISLTKTKVTPFNFLENIIICISLVFINIINVNLNSMNAFIVILIINIWIFFALIIDLFKYISSDEYCYEQSKKYIENLNIEREEYANWLSKMKNQLDVSKLNAKEFSQNIDILMFHLKDISYTGNQRLSSLYLTNDILILYFCKLDKIVEKRDVQNNYYKSLFEFFDINIEKLYIKNDDDSITISREENRFILTESIIGTFDTNNFDIYYLIDYFSNLSSSTNMENIRNIEYFSVEMMLEIAYIYIFYNHEKYDINKFTKYFFKFQYNKVFILYLLFVLIYVLLYNDTVDIFKEKVEYIIKKYYKIINIDMSMSMNNKKTDINTISKIYNFSNNLNSNTVFKYMLNGIYYSNYSSSSTLYDFPSIFNGYMSLLLIHSYESILDHGIKNLEDNTIKNILNLFDITKEKIGLKEDNVKRIEDIYSILDESNFNISDNDIMSDNNISSIYNLFKDEFYDRIIKKEEVSTEDMNTNKKEYLNRLEDSIKKSSFYNLNKLDNINYKKINLLYNFYDNTIMQVSASYISDMLCFNILKNFINEKNIAHYEKQDTEKVDSSNYDTYMINHPLSNLNEKDKIFNDKFKYKGLLFSKEYYKEYYNDIFIYKADKLNCYFDLESLDIKYEDLSSEKMKSEIEQCEKFEDNYIYTYHCVDLLLNYDDLSNLIKVRLKKINVLINFYYEDNENIGVIITGL